MYYDNVSPLLTYENLTIVKYNIINVRNIYILVLFTKRIGDKMMNIEITNQEHNLLIACLTVAENEAKKRGDTITQLNVGKLREKISETLFKGGDL